ncbi:insulinase family protein [Oceanospirillum sediminis]|uniref:Protease 3 n=1 Tax=Oceanospirillum sediminis TaxID=2760088 RepID=A0A839IRA9_9GAMM|nr:insulinase family protein [Oceanospirillum sediminis]MBB1487204.1 insulinase family protein [Oceanospirillum sediminis]
MPNQSTTDIIKSENDSRSYRSLTLQNQLEVIVISDPDTDKAAAALNVATGSGNDPDDYPGLAHFLEHMLFLGTEKYPEAGEYQSFISKHGGSHNAFTSFEDTNYFFEVDSDYLSPTLDRFAQFFISPLFSEEYVKREINAVHSEYQSKLRDDGRRQFDILKAIINPAHPYSKFSTGSLETLSSKGKALSTREAMLNFYQTEYSANRMSLVILGKESLNQLEQLARELFSPVINRELKVKEVNQPLFTEGQLPGLLTIKPLKARHELKLQFPIPQSTPFYREKPTGYLANLIGHEGNGSLLSALKARGWATGLSAGRGISTRENSLFSIAINLTEDGYKHQSEVINAVFSYLQLLNQSGIELWRYQEQKVLAEQEFRFREQISPIHYVSNLAFSMPRYPAQDLLVAPYLMDNFNESLIREYLSYMTPDNVLITRISPDAETDQVSPWFNGSYAFKAASSDKIVPLSSNIFKLPEPNPFIASNLHLKKAQPTRPINISPVPQATLWFSHDTEFNTPKAQQYFSLQSPVSSESVRNAVLSQMLSSWLKEVSNEFAYPARLAGLDYTVYKHIRGITIQLGGYDEQQHQLLDKLLYLLTRTPIDQESWQLVKQSLIKRWKNADKAPLYHQIMGETSAVLMTPDWNEKQLLSAIEPLTLKDLEAFRSQFLSQIYIDSMIIGNMTQEEALNSFNTVISTLKPTLTKQDVPGIRVHALTENLLQHQPEIEHNDNAVVHYYQGQSASIKDQALWMLAARLLEAPYYHEMRTQQQLGYIVFASYHPMMKLPGLSLIVQSPGHTPEDITQRSNTFIQTFSQQLPDMPDREFEQQKAGLIANLLEKDDHLKARSQGYWRDMALEYTGFDRRQQLATAVEQLSLQDISQLFNKEINGNQSRQLIVSYQSGSTRFSDSGTLKARLPAVDQ